MPLHRYCLRAKAFESGVTHRMSDRKKIVLMVNNNCMLKLVSKAPLTLVLGGQTFYRRTAVIGLMLFYTCRLGGTTKLSRGAGGGAIQ